MLDEFEDVRSSSDTIGKSTGSVSSQAKEGDDARSIRVELRMVTWLVIE